GIRDLIVTGVQTCALPIFNSGVLAGRESWNYRPAPPEIVNRVKKIRAICDSHQVPLVAAALQFPLAHPAVAAILPGPRNVDELEIGRASCRERVEVAVGGV